MIAPRIRPGQRTFLCILLPLFAMLFKCKMVFRTLIVGDWLLLNIQRALRNSPDNGGGMTQSKCCNIQR